MKYILIIFILVGFIRCGTVPIDASPDWETANRFGVEVKNDCNINQHSIGLGGCAFFENKVYGNLILPSVWNGLLTFKSSYCNSFTLTANLNDNIIPLQSIYNNHYKSNCSFQVNRTVKDGKLSSENPMIGRFLIKIIPNNPFFTKLQFAVNETNFDSVGWFQRLYGKQDAVLNIRTLGNKGIFTISCNGEKTLEQEYTTNKFSINLDSKINCDYELSATNYDSPYKELGSFIHMVSTYTDDISIPIVSIKSNKITFTFNDKDSSGKKPVVIGVQVENTKCKATNKCTVVHNKSIYFVKAYTPSLRPFYQYYDIASKTWGSL
jgi:hypothetical protein